MYLINASKLQLDYALRSTKTLEYLECIIVASNLSISGVVSGIVLPADTLTIAWVGKATKVYRENDIGLGRFYLGRTGSKATLR